MRFPKRKNGERLLQRVFGGMNSRTRGAQRMRVSTVLGTLLLVMTVSFLIGCEKNSPFYQDLQRIVDEYNNGDTAVTYNLRGKGPAGGLIFYDKGSYSDGWRYLEAAPYGWDSGGDDPAAEFGAREYNVAGTVGNAAIGQGKINTNLIVVFHDSLTSTDGNNATYYDLYNDYGTLYNTVDIFTDGSTNYTFHNNNYGTVAAKLCADYSVVYEGTTYDDWFLPSIDELARMCYVLHSRDSSGNDNPAYGSIRVGGFQDTEYWSSTDHSNTDISYSHDFTTGVSDYNLKWTSTPRRVRPVRSF